MGAADGLEHLRIGPDTGEQPVDQAFGLNAEQRGEAPLEGRLVDLALLQRDQQLAGRGVLAEAPDQELGIELDAQAVGVEGGEQVRRQYSAPVDQQAGTGHRRLFQLSPGRGRGCVQSAI